MYSRSKFEWIQKMKFHEDRLRPRKSSIICTIGPDVKSVEMLTKLREAGMNIVRLNFSHGSYEYHQSVIDNARESLRLYPFGRTIAIALDTKGPEIRTGLMKDNVSATYVADSLVTITCDPKFAEACDEKTLYVDYRGIVSLAPGKIILVEDGNISFRVQEVVDSMTIRARALNTHTLSSRKNVNLPGTPVDLPAVSEKDKMDLQFAVKNNLDMVFASFIRRAEDVDSIRQVLGEAGSRIKIISKIENWQGIDNFDEILEVSDGIMVARGDLGMEIPLEKVFVAQKVMIAKCNIAGKPVICATQMLESMTYNSRPTRAEVSDVANAILDGADCVMLSGETAKGKYPLEAVKMMHLTCLEAESVFCHSSHFMELCEITNKPLCTTETIACSAVNATMEQEDISAIFVLTTSGESARFVSKYRPAVPIIAITRDEIVSRQIHLNRGCFPVLTGKPGEFNSVSAWQNNVDNRIRIAVERAVEMNLIPRVGKIIAIQGWGGGSGKTNTLRVLETESILDSPSSTPMM